MAGSKNGRGIKLASYDSIFDSEESAREAQLEKVRMIRIDQIDPFPNHPYKVEVNEQMMEMAESIAQYGVLVPTLIRPKEDGRYEMVAGHRRLKASELASQNEIPCIVRELSNDEAIILMVDSNLQREELLPSEKAFSYRMRLEAMNRQAGRPANNLTPVVSEKNRLRTSEQLAEKVGESREQIRRYIRLTELSPSILQMVDEQQIAFRPAVELSYLKADEQQLLYMTIESEDRTPSLSQAQRMKKLSQEGKLDENVIFAIMTEDKPNQKEKIVLKDKRFDKYFPQDFTAKQKEDLLARLLEKWYQSRKRQQER